MEYLKINYEEVSALRGLPHMQQLLYICGIKPFVDYRTGIQLVVGLINPTNFSIARCTYGFQRT